MRIPEADLLLGNGEKLRLAEAKYDFARRQLHRVHYVLLPDGAGRCR